MVQYGPDFQMLCFSKVLEAVTEVLGDTDSSVLAINVGTEAGIRAWKGPSFHQVPSPLILHDCPIDA